MAREVITLECTEAKAEGKPVSRYLSSRNKKTVTERVEKKEVQQELEAPYASPGNKVDPPPQRIVEGGTGSVSLFCV